MFEIKDLISPTVTGVSVIVSTIMAVKGWQKTSEASRRHHIFQTRLAKRMLMYDDLVAVLEITSRWKGDIKLTPEDNATLVEKFVKARTSVLLYGYQEEIAIFQRFGKALIDVNISEINTSQPLLADLVIGNLRKELEYAK